MLQFPKTLSRRKADTFEDICANMREDITTFVQISRAYGHGACLANVTPENPHLAVTKKITTELVEVFGFGYVLHQQGAEPNGIPIWLYVPVDGIEQPHNGKVCIVFNREE